MPKTIRLILALCFFALAPIHQALSQPGKASEYQKLLDEAVKAKDFRTAAELAYQFAEVMVSDGNKSAAKKLLIQSIGHARKVNSSTLAYTPTFRLGNIYFENGDFSNAADYFGRAAKIARDINAYDDAVRSSLNEGLSYYRSGRFKKAVDPVEVALQLAIANNQLTDQIQCYDLLADYYRRSGNPRKAEESEKLASTMRTLIDRELHAKEKANELQVQAVAAIAENVQSQQRLEKQSEKLRQTEESLKITEEISENRQLEIDLLNKDRELSQLRIQEQNIRLQNEALIRNSILVVIALVSAIAGLIVVNYRRSVRSNKKLDLQNKNIKSSINYAKRIQEAMLPKKEVPQTLLGDSFILFRPRDTVSGDFYWFSSLKSITGKDDVVFAAIDCTGHGVPGAFMSMIGINSLNSIISRGITQTSDILSALHQEIRNALKQDETGNNDGMDVAICIYRKDEKILQFSGAKNPLYYITDNELKQIKGDIHSIGGSRTKADARFSQHEIHINKPTTVYLFTDGFRDQFGGPDNTKFMSKRFSKLLLDIHQLPLQEQLDRLGNEFESWKGRYEQTDDVLVLGTRLGS